MEQERKDIDSIIREMERFQRDYDNILRHIWSVGIPVDAQIEDLADEENSPEAKIMRRMARSLADAWTTMSGIDGEILEVKKCLEAAKGEVQDE